MNQQHAFYSKWSRFPFLGFLFLQLCSTGALAAASSPQPSARIYTIKQAVQEALTNSPSLKQTRETMNQAKSATDLLRANIYPTLSYTLKAGSAQAATLGATSALFGGSTYNNYNGALQLVQPLFVHGSLDAIASGEFTEKLNKVNVEIAERALVSQVVQAFYNIVLNQRLLNFLEETKGVLEKSLEVSTGRYRIGRAQLLDVLQAKTQLASLQPQIEQARNNFVASGVQLAGLMGLQGQSQIQVKGQLRTLSYKEVERKLDLKNYYLPEIEQNKIQIQQLGKSKEVEMGKYWPTLSFTGTYTSNSYTQSDFVNPAAQSWSAYVGLTIPIFQGFASKNDSAVYLSQELQLEHARAQLEETINTNQVTSKTALDSAEVSLSTAVTADKLAQESLAEAVRQYRLATIDFLQFLSIEQSALTAKSQVESLRYQSIVAYTNYFVAMGQPLDKLIDLLNSGDGK